MRVLKITLSLLMILVSQLYANTRRYRLTYRTDPATSMVIGWEQDGGTSPVVYFDTVDHGTNWASYAFNHGVDRSTSRMGMDHKFARLTGLQPNTAYYFVIRDSDGTSNRFWFKTLSNNPNIPLSIIAGGDSRTNPGARQNANKLVAKLRPDFIFFGGDYTELNMSWEWQDWFDDWQLTTSADGRMYPIVGARGNHEWSNNDVYEMFDTPHPDAYYALTFGGSLLRAYTLNSESAIPGNQTNWLVNDLITNQNTVEWKIAQYHKPMRPHVSSKSEGNDQYNNWAQPFFDYGVRLVVECDAHTVKSTWKVKPSIALGSQEGFIREDIGGTVYIGEGCWGAPLRSANDTKSWTRNSDVFNHFNWIKVTKERMEVKYVKTDNSDSVGIVNDSARFVEPSNIDIWNPTNGKVIIIDNEKYAGRPSVSITAPLTGTGYATPQLVSIMANAQDTAGQVDYVEFFVNDISIGRDSTAPYDMNWNMPANGNYILTAWAMDSSGYHNISNNVHVFVGNVDITAKVSASSDDAEEDIDDNSVDIGSSDLELALEDNSWPLGDDDQIIGLRFPKINIPSGANITNAYIQFYADGDFSGTTNLSIYGEKTPSALEFSETNRNISSRTKTTSTINWNPPAWQNGNAGLNEQTPSLNSIVSEIINQPGWEIGNDMAFIIEGSGTRRAYSYDGSSISAPELHITFNVNGSSTQTKEIKLEVPQFSLYPNPFQNELNIKWDETLQEIDIKVFDLSGKLVHHEKDQNTNQIKLSLDNNLPKGQYFVKLTSNQFEVIEKVIKL